MISKYKLFLMNYNQSNINSKSMGTHQKQQIKKKKKTEPMANLTIESRDVS